MRPVTAQFLENCTPLTACSIDAVQASALQQARDHTNRLLDSAERQGVAASK
jgi:hypothetical protein